MQQMRKSHSQEESITVVRDTAAYFNHLYTKDATALPVRGLDNDTGMGDVYAPSSVGGAGGTGAGEDDAGGFVGLLSSRGLLGGLGAASLISVWFAYFYSSSATQRLECDFADDEKTLWGCANRPGEALFDFVLRAAPLLAFPHALCALFSGLLALYVGGRTANFFAFCGVGLSMLGVMATAGQHVTLFYGCGLSPISQKWECDIPRVLVVLCSFFKWGGPLLAVCAVGPALDAGRGGALRWRLALAPAPLMLAVQLVVGLKAGGQFDKDSLRSVLVANMASWSVLVASLLTSPTIFAGLRRPAHLKVD